MSNIIKSLSLISSCDCNLNCEYCQISMNKNEQIHDFQKKTIESFENGTFLKNVCAVFEKLQSGRGAIQNIQLWGQEPTLTLQHLTNHLEDWLIAFPSWNSMFFSTNGVAFYDRLVQFVLTLDQNIDHLFNLSIQFSYDGDYGTNKFRKANTVAIINNIKNFILNLNQHHLKFVTVDVHFHGVLPLELIKELNNQGIEQIKNYFDASSEFAEQFFNLGLNSNVHIPDFIGFSFENPLQTSAEEGRIISEFYKKCLSISVETFKYPQSMNSINCLGGFFTHSLAEIKEEFDLQSLTQLLSVLTSPEVDKNYYKELLTKLSKLNFCSALEGELKIMYDGTCMFCQNILALSHHNNNFLQYDGTIKTAALHSFQEHNFFFNPLIDDPKNFIPLLKWFETAKNENFLFLYQETINLMTHLLKVRQIDSIYNDSDKLFEHAFYMTCLTSCPYNHYIETGSLYGRSLGLIRAYCNGFLDEVIIQSDINQKAKKMNKRGL